MTAEEDKMCLTDVATTNQLVHPPKKNHKQGLILKSKMKSLKSIFEKNKRNHLLRAIIPLVAIAIKDNNIIKIGLPVCLESEIALTVLMDLSEL